MGFYLIKIPKLRMLAMLSLSAILVSLLSIPYIASEDRENVDLSVLASHHIIIDPGHGGVDSGATANNAIEKEITLKVSAKLAEVLRKHGALVSLTREEDIDYYTRGKGGKRKDLLKRIEMMEQSGAEIFISIHCNAFRGANLSGAQVFYSPKFPESKLLAEKIQQNLKDFPKGNKRQIKEDLRILVLNGTKMPGVLIETGYLTNHQEALLLVDDVYQQKLAEEIATGLAYHFKQYVAK